MTYPLLDGVVRLLGDLRDDPERGRRVVEVVTVRIEVLQVVFEQEPVLGQPLDGLEHVVLYPQVLAPILALEFCHQLLELGQPAEAVFEVITQAGELPDVVVVKLQKGTFLGDDVGDLLALAPVLDPRLEVLEEVFVEGLKLGQVVENSSVLGVADDRRLRLLSSFLEVRRLRHFSVTLALL